MPDPELFRRKIEQIRPNHLVKDLKPGVVLVAILKPAIDSDLYFNVNDVFWAKSLAAKPVSILLNAFKRVDLKDVFLYHNSKRLSTNCMISSLVTKAETCALEAVYVTDIAKQHARDSLRNAPTYFGYDVASRKSHTPSTHQGSVLQEIKNDAVTREKAVSPLFSKQIVPPIQASINSSREWSRTPISAGLIRSQSSVSDHMSPALGPNGCSIYESNPHFLAWTDFTFDHREYNYRTLRLVTRQTLGYSFDATVEREWLDLTPEQRQYHVDRSRKGRFQSLREHRAFWIYYYDRFFDSEANGNNPHVNFESTSKFFNDIVTEWLALEPQTRGVISQSATYETCSILPLPLGSTLPLPRHPSAYPDLPSASSTGSGQWHNPQGSYSPHIPPLKTPTYSTQIIEPESSSLDTPEEMAQSIQNDNMLPDKLNVSDLFESQSIEKLEAGMAKGAEILESIKQELGSEPSEESEHWLATIANLEKQITRTKTIVGVVGATGAGKSSVINAILDEERLVPTNCMRACTAVVTEISYNHEDIPYRAEIDFISRDDWMKELKTSFQDLFDGTGKVSRECTNEDSEAGIAYAKIKAVYPLMTKDNMENTTVDNLLNHTNVKNLLGGNRSIEENNSSVFYKQLQRYVDSKEKAFSRDKKTEVEKIKARQMEFWPLIRVVRLYVKAPALATGAVIVDLPGVHDSNQARAAVAQGYLKQCTGLWIVAPITRAVDDKSAKTLLGDTFKRQLKMDGGYNSVTFICSKTDDISITEAQDSLGLDGEMAPLYTKSEALEATKRCLKSELEELRNKRSDITSGMDSIDEQLEVWEKIEEDLEDGKTVFAPKAGGGQRKRRHSSEAERPKKRTKYSEDSDDDFVADDSDHDAGSDEEHEPDIETDAGEPLTADTINERLSALKASKKESRREKAALEQPMTDLKTRMSEIDQERDEIDNELLGKCIRGRNEYSRGAIQQDFASGIRELDQEIAEEEDAANFNPDVDVRDYEAVANSLPVFCVSSRGYQQIMGRLTKDKRATMFQSVDDTGVPALQQHCEKLTVTNREVSCKRFLNNLSQFLNSLRLWSSSDGTTAHLTDEQKRREAEFLGTQLRKLDTALENAVTSTCSNVSNEINESLYDKFPVALQAGRNEANDTQAKWGAPVNRENRAQGGLYWATYKAAVRRNGVWSGNDFNNDLIEPVIKQVAPGWDKVFSRRLAQNFSSFANNVHQVLMEFHGTIEKRTTRAGSSIATFQMLKQQLTAYKEVAKDTGIIAQTFINTRQRDVNREFVPAITEAMTPVYERTAAEVGPGQYKRMKDEMQTHVSWSQENMFQDSLDHVKQRLRAMLKEAEDLMMGKVDEIFVSVKRDYESVVVGRKRKANEEVQLSKQQRKIRREVLNIVDSVELTMQRVVDIEFIEGGNVISEQQVQFVSPSSGGEAANVMEAAETSNQDSYPLKTEEADGDNSPISQEHQERAQATEDDMTVAPRVTLETLLADVENAAKLSETGIRSASSIPEFQTPEEIRIKSEDDDAVTPHQRVSQSTKRAMPPEFEDSEGSEEGGDSNAGQDIPFA